MRVAVIDTASPWLGVAVAGKHGVASCIESTGLRHGANLLPAIRQCLRDAGVTIAELQAVVCVRGPGSFTGVRIGLAAAKALVQATGCRGLGILSTHGAALRLRSEAGPVLVLLDARKQRFYAALYQEGRQVRPVADLTPEEVVQLVHGQQAPILTGPGAAAFRAVCPTARGWPLDPNAALPNPAALIPFGAGERPQGLATEGLAPLYLRDSEAELGIGASGQKWIEPKTP